jgi:hypothetical protein
MRLLVSFFCSTPANLSLMWFTVFSSIVHAGIMTWQALSLPAEHGHLVGDVPALFVAAVVLAILTPRGADAAALRNPVTGCP